MKALLICPAYRSAVEILAKRSPLAGLPLLGVSVIEYWLAHLASVGARHVTVLASDQVDELARITGDGARWGLKVDLLQTPIEPTAEEARIRYLGKEERTDWLPAPDDVNVLEHLPRMPERNLFASYENWFLGAQGWMPRALTPDRVGWREIRSGVYVALNSRIPHDANLCPPCWIGEKVFLGSGVTVGPMAVVENRAMVEAGAEIVRSIVGPETFVGRYAEIRDSLAWGGLLVDWRTGSCLSVPDPYLLSPLREPSGSLRKWRLADLWPVREPAQAPRERSSLSNLEQDILLRDEN